MIGQPRNRVRKVPVHSLSNIYFGGCGGHHNDLGAASVRLMAHPGEPTALWHDIDCVEAIRQDAVEKGLTLCCAIVDQPEETCGHQLSCI